MSDEGFFKRWSRLKARGEAGAAEAVEREPAQAPAIPPARPAAEPAPERAAPTLADVARLTPDADFSAFVAHDVDKAVQRLALKKLFADPHFKVLDGLDMYMDDYNKPSPVSAAMLAALDHARGALRLPERAAAETPSGTEEAPGQPAAAPAIVTQSIVTQEQGGDAYTEAEDRPATVAGPAPSSPQGPA